MNEDILKGKWRQFKGGIQEKWGEFTDDELDQINGEREQFLGKLQEKYGYGRDKAEKELNSYLDSVSHNTNGTHNGNGQNGASMNEDVLKGKWRQFKGNIQERWGELTNDELDQIDGEREQMIGKLQEKYGYSREKAQTEYDDFVHTMAGKVR